MALRSARYEGTVVHHRAAPTHRFAYAFAAPLVDLAEVAEVAALQPFGGSGRLAPVRFHRADYLGDDAVPLDVAVRDEVARATGTRPVGPIALLAQWRTLGWCFNPISCYFCFDETGRDVEWLVAEVTNTPWRERHAYVLGPPGTHTVSKQLHVSPMLPMGLSYEITYTAPADRLRLKIDVLDAGRQVLHADLSLRRTALTRGALARAWWRQPAMPARISAGIYAQAARLKLKGAPTHGHPGTRERRRRPAA